MTQKTRYLRLGNGAQKKVTFFIRYHAPDEDASFQWFPGEGDEPVAIRVAPGASRRSMIIARL